ncbi:MAG: ice-binding family protein [Bacteroidota bacterium]
MNITTKTPTRGSTFWLRFTGLCIAAFIAVSATVSAQPIAPLNLGSTADYVILAGSLISNVPTSNVTGNIGLSPAAGSAITGFGLTEITGNIYTVDATGPVGSIMAPAQLTAAKGDLTIAFNEAAGRTPVPTGTFLNPGSGNMGGLTLVPGLYKFTSDALITGSDLTLTGTATDVWIFQISAALNVGNGIHVVLSGGAQASNIFWQVGTSAALGTTSIMKGTILAAQSITLGTGATLDGRALASNAAVTLASSTVTLPPVVEPFDDPLKLIVKNAGAPVLLDGKLDEADWNGAPSLLFGKGADGRKLEGDKSVTAGFDLKASFDVNAVTYHVPNKDSSWTRVKFLRRGSDLYIGLQSNDKSICKFDWEADGLFMKVKNSVGVDKEYKLYWQNIDANKDSIKYEEGVLNSGAGAGFLPVGSTVNDTANTDNGYTAEMKLKLGSLGYAQSLSSLELAMTIFDPDGFKHPMNSWDSARGSYYKSWWGSEWGGTYRTLGFIKEYDNTDTIAAKISSSVITMDGKLTETDWATANTLVFGPSTAPTTGTEKTVTGGIDVKNSFNVNGVQYYLPYKDTSYTKVKFLVKGNELFIGIQSPDKSICKFDWEADGLFLKIKNSAGDDKEFKLYWQNTDANKDTIRYEEQVLNSGAGAGFLTAGSTVNDTLNIDNGYTAELKIKLSTLGFTASTSTVNLKVAMTIFDPDGYQHPMAAWDSARGSYFKSWWGSEWGGTYKTISLPRTTGVTNQDAIPVQFALQQNYPNPFNPSTSIEYSISIGAQVTLKVYSILGEEVATLVNSSQDAGTYAVAFSTDALNLASGVYFYRLESGSFSSMKKMVLLK